FVENSKAKDLAATLEAIYGRPGGTRAAPVPGAAPGALPASTPTPAPALPRVPGAGGGEIGATPADLPLIADEGTHAILRPTYPRLWREIDETIKKLDRLARQVLIEVLAAEVTLTDETKLGIEWAVRSGKFTITNTQNSGTTGTGTTPTPPGSGIIRTGALVAPGLNMFVAASDFVAALNALASENNVNLLASPSLMPTA